MRQTDKAQKNHLPKTQVLISDVYTIFHLLNYPRSHKYFKKQAAIKIPHT